MIQVSAKLLAEKLAFAQSGTHPRPFIAALSSVVLRVHRGSLTARSFNTVAHSVVRVADASGAPEGETVVNLERTARNLKRLGQDNVTIKFDWEAQTVQFRSGRKKWVERGEYAEAFVVWPSGLPETQDYPLNLSRELGSAEAVVDVKSPFESAIGVRIESNGVLDVVGTDGHTVTVSRNRQPLPSFEGGVTLPMDSISQFRTVFEQGSVKVGVSKKWVVAEAGDYLVASTAMYGEYPNYNGVLLDADDAGASFIVSLNDFLQAVQVGGEFTDPDTRALMLHVTESGGEKVMVVEGSGMMVTGAAEIEVPYVGDALDIYIRVDHAKITRALRDFSGETEVRVLLNDADEPTRMQLQASDNSDGHIVVVMLMRIPQGVQL